ncbi:hypothetical protein C8R43DRAFT_1130846 [Mycena crocata]|nr:hypothetical protein C8R43DRAFT_1130846 [Mycena crocata]
MPTTLPTTSLVAGGGDDLDDGRCHSRRLPIFCADSGGIALVVGDVEYKVCAKYGVFRLGPRPRCLGQHRRPRRALGKFGAPRRTEIQLGKLQCPDNMLANPDGALPIRERAHFHGVHLVNPRPLFPTVELAPTRFPRPDRKCIASGPRSLRSTARFGSNRELEVQSLCSFFVPYRRYRIHPEKPRVLRPSPDSATRKYPATALSMPVGIILGALTRRVIGSLPLLVLHIGFIVTDWLLPQTPKSFTNAVNASFRLELVSLDFNNKLILAFESEFYFKTRAGADFSHPATLRPGLSLTCANSSTRHSLRFCRVTSGPGILGAFKFESPAIHSEAGICAPKGRDYHCGPLIGLPSRSCSKLKAGSIFTYTQDSDSNWILTRGHPYTVTIAKPKTVVNSDLLKPSLVNTPSSFGYGLCPSMIERLNVSQSLPRLEAIQHEGRTYRYFPQYVYAALPHIESQDTETIVHLLQFNYFKVLEYNLPSPSSEHSKTPAISDTSQPSILS